MLFVCVAHSLQGRTANAVPLLRDDTSDVEELSDNDNDAADPDFNAQSTDSEDNSSNGDEQADNEDSSDGSDDEPLQLRAQRWRPIDNFTPESFPFDDPADDVDSRSDWTPSDFVLEYLNRETFKMIAEKTNRTSVELTGVTLGTTAEEVRQFFWREHYHVDSGISSN